jgi:2-polyprenyl-6-hydroxyphenyl methylase/3-demethylubiquinone-9 3-methyltransferase
LTPSIGQLVRGMFGPYERPISDAYRAIFLDIGDFVSQIQRWRPDASRILEVGCGEGALIERLRVSYPDADITGIDLTPRLGRLYGGPRERVRFIQCPVEDIAAAEPGQYDLVALCDVLHHVPEAVRQSLLDAIRATLAPGGVLVFKDWERTGTLIHWLCYASDRWITGDRVAYMTRDEMRTRLSASFGADALIAEARTAPWRNNIAMLIQP